MKTVSAFILFNVCAWGQVIPIQTVPFVGSDQLLITPSRNLVAGNISIAAEDPLADPFVNPAAGSSANGLTLYSTPTFVAPSRTSTASLLSFGGIYGAASFFGGFYAAKQDVRSNSPSFSTIPSSIANKPNSYFYALAGWKFSRGNSVAAAYFQGSVIQLAEIQQQQLAEFDDSGNRVEEFRLGLEQRKPDGATIDLVVVHQRVSLDYVIT